MDAETCQHDRAAAVDHQSQFGQPVSIGMKRKTFELSTRLIACVALGVVALLVRTVPAVQEPQTSAPERKNGLEIPVVTSGYLVLIRDPVVQEQLKLSKNQQQAIQRLTDTIDGPLWALRGLRSSEHAVALNQLITRTRPKADQILSRQQSTRLDEIVLRAGWPQSLLFGNVRQELKYTSEQLQRIVEKLRETQTKLQNQDTKKSAVDDVRARGKTLEAEWRMLLLDILDDDQHKKLTALLGRPFDATGIGNVKFKAPPLDGSDGWINSRPLSMQQLRGRVIVLHYLAYG